MEKIAGELHFGWQDIHINNLLQNNAKEIESFSRHYNQNEDFFLRLAKPFQVPQFPIHHDVDNPKPSEQYKKSLAELLTQVLSQAGNIFAGLNYAFDPAEIFRPFFFQLYKVKEQYYLYLLRLDLQYRPNGGTILKKGSNDVTHLYETRNLFLDCDIIPLKQINRDEQGKITGCALEQVVSQTWIGESGRGYIIQGIWIDNDLTKFFSKLLLPENKRSYPYYPFTCKHRTVCHSVLDFSPLGRKKHLTIAHRAKPFLEKHIEVMQNVLKQESFSTNLYQYKELKKQVPPSWSAIWEGLTVTPYLNDQDMKEFEVVYN